jgi:Fe-S-cluster containining protein
LYTPLAELKKNRKKRKILTRFLRGLTHRKVKSLDEKAIELNKEEYTKMDCMKCANCCKTMQPTWKKAEVKRVANHLGLSYKEYFDKYLVLDEGDIMNKNAPCQHLAKNHMCNIYDMRPGDCRGFPHTHKRDFKLFISGTHIQNIDYCPITYYVVDNLFTKVTEDAKKKQNTQ